MIYCKFSKLQKAVSFSLMIQLSKTFLRGQEKRLSSVQRLFSSPEVLKHISLDINLHSHLARLKSKSEPRAHLTWDIAAKESSALQLNCQQHPIGKADPQSTLFYFSLLVIFATSLRQLVLKRSLLVFICKRKAIYLQWFLRFLSSLINNKVFLFYRKIKDELFYGKFRVTFKGDQHLGPTAETPQ